MQGFALLSVVALAVDHAVVQRKQHIRGDGAALVRKDAKSFVRALDFQRRLRVCNGYPYAAALDVSKGASKLTAEEPMSYKTCRDFETELAPGDKLIFKVGEANAGTFSVSDMPNNDAILLLVIFRHDTLSTAVAFESHVYANLLNAQVAVVDTYKGTEKATLKIQDHEDAKTSRSEELRFDSVVAVNPGKYDVNLIGSDGQVVAEKSLVALNRESYVVMRVGVKSQQGPSYPQELVVFPKSDAAALSFAFAASLLALLF
jgi:hypothetical protein